MLDVNLVCLYCGGLFWMQGIHARQDHKSIGRLEQLQLLVQVSK